MILFFALLVAFVFAFIDVRDMPWRNLYARTYVFAQFRHPSACCPSVRWRFLFWVGWDWIRCGGPRAEGALAHTLHPWLGPCGDGWVGLLLVAGFMIGSVADVFTTNKQHARTRDPFPPASEIMTWLRGYDSSVHYVGNPVGWHGAILLNGLRYIDAWYHFSDIRSFPGMINRRQVRARPNYLAQASDQPVTLPDPIPVQQIAGHTVYKLPHSLPYAFTVNDQALSDTAAGRELWAEDVTSQQATIPGPNGVEVEAQGDVTSTLVVLTTAYPGWRVTADGRRQPLVNVGGYLAVRTLPGLHKYLLASILSHSRWG